MSNEPELKAHDKVVLRMTRDGAVEKNLTAGTEQRVLDDVYNGFDDDTLRLLDLEVKEVPEMPDPKLSVQDILHMRSPPNLHTLPKLIS